MKYFRIHTAEKAYLTKQPRGIFTAVWKLVESGILNEEEIKEYWRNREYFEKVLPVPPIYDDGNPAGAITWFKDTEEGKEIYAQMSFYRLSFLLTVKLKLYAVLNLQSTAFLFLHPEERNFL